MAAIGTALMGKVLGHSDAERAFRPWWDSLEDFLIYGLVMLGVIIVPTAIITGTPLDCNYCQSDHCTFNGTSPQYTNEIHNYTNPGFNMWWVKKYCTMNGSVEPFMLYFPYFLLFIALSLFFIERMFLKAFKAGTKLEKFYSLLVSEKVLEANTGNQSNQDMVDGGMEAIELRQSFRGSQSYFLSYLLRTIIEVFVASVLLIYMSLRGLPVLKHADTIICDVHSFYFECSGQPAQFYVYILLITCCITILYILCNVYNLLWLAMPCFGSLSRLMTNYRSNMRSLDITNSKSDKEILGDLYDIYYNNRDLRLLLDLLATSSGVAPAIAIMTMFDKNFSNAMKPKIDYISTSRDLGIVEIQFQEPKTGVRASLADIRGVHLLYVAEIVPPASTAVEAFDSMYVPERQKDGSIENIEMASLQGFIQRASFEGLKKDVSYTIKVSTVVNGKTICQVSEDLMEQHERLPPQNSLKPRVVMEQHERLPPQNGLKPRVVNEQGDCENSCNVNQSYVTQKE